MYNKIYKKNQEILEILKKDGYCVSAIEQNEKLLYVAVQVGDRTIIIDYDRGFYEMGEIYKVNTKEIYNPFFPKNACAIFYAYGFKQYRKGNIEDYLFDVPSEISPNELGDKETLMRWLKENNLTIKKLDEQYKSKERKRNNGNKNE